MQPIHVSRPGTHVDSAGREWTFTEADFAASAAAYDPALHEAPIVVGHPRHNLPAYGWVKSLAAGKSGLTADPAQVDAAFSELVAAGRYKKISASFFPPHSPNNPVPGVWYLRHVGFLGAQPPAVKGLRPVEFADADEGVVTVEFSEAFAWNSLRGFFTRFREWLLVNHGQEAADQVVQPWMADDMDMAARIEAEEDQQELAAAAMPQPAMFSEPNPKKDQPMSEAEKARLAELEAENAALKATAGEVQAKSAEFAEREQALADKEAATRRGEIETFVADQVKAGRVLPVDQAGMVAFMASVDAADVVEFAEGDATVSKPAAEWLRSFIAGLPARVDFSERARGHDAGAHTADFAAPAGYGVDSAALDVRARAKALMKTDPNLSFIDAVKTAEKDHA